MVSKKYFSEGRKLVLWRAKLILSSDVKLSYFLCRRVSYTWQLEWGKADQGGLACFNPSGYQRFINFALSTYFKLSVCKAGSFINIIQAKLTPSYGVYISQLIRFAEHLAMLLTSTLAINRLHKHFLNKAIGIINFAKHFLNFKDDTMISIEKALVTLYVTT